MKYGTQTFLIVEEARQKEKQSTGSLRNTALGSSRLNVTGQYNLEELYLLRIKSINHTALHTLLLLSK